MALLPQVWSHIDAPIVIYALLSLTVIRMIPVFISLLGKKLRWETKLFLGWFGPRGLASILFVLLVLEHANLVNESLVLDTVIVTVAFSILLHGISALPGVNTYAMALRICEARGDDLTSEQKAVSDMPLKYSSASNQQKDEVS